MSSAINGANKGRPEDGAIRSGAWPALLRAVRRPAFLLQKRPGKRAGSSYWNALLTRAGVTCVMLAVSSCGSPARAGTLYWDADGSTEANNASTGGNLGGSGIWSTADANWWDTSLGTPQAWADRSDAVFW